MSGPIITVESLSKCYHIGRQSTKGDGLRHAIEALVRNPLNWFRAKSRKWRENREEFWALKDVSFEVKRGEVVGIIGRNGAGKSTLLKILSRITEPTQGRIELSGRVACLLEVGTGFHPELTGRENIFLNGAILGMTKAEIRRKFDEIVAFSEVEKFLDTPVKRYSSGMYVRLAFAVAAHLEPEILVVDEVLAVGDAAFQKKCLGKMHDVAAGGRTVLFVSHNMAAIKNLCPQCIYLKEGALVSQSETERAIDAYLSDTKEILSITSLSMRKDRMGSGRAKIVDFFVTDEKRNIHKVLKPGMDYIFAMKYRKTDSKDAIGDTIGSISVNNGTGQTILLFRSNFSNQNFVLPSDQGVIQCKVKDLNLAPGTYNINVYLSRGENEVLDYVMDAAQISVEGGDYFGTGSIGIPEICKVLSRTDWQST